MTSREDTEYFSVREYASLAMASVAADPAARSCHLELARLYRLRGMSPTRAAVPHDLHYDSTGWAATADMRLP